MPDMILPKTLTDDELAALCSDLTPENRQELAAHFMRLAAKISKNYVKDGSLDEDEAFAIACLGLVKAASKFDPSKKVKFSTYAAPCIVNELNMYLRNDHRKHPYQTISLSQPVPGLDTDGDSPTLQDILSDGWKSYNEMYSGVNQETIRDLYLETLGKFNERQQRVILDGLHGHTQTQIAKRRGYSKAQVSNIYRNFRTKLKEKLNRRGWDL